MDWRYLDDVMEKMSFSDPSEEMDEGVCYYDYIIGLSEWESH